MPGPLAGIRVIDWTMMGVGPFTGALLGALGADVVKVEPPEGDFMAKVAPTIGGVGGSYLAVNTSKRSMRIDVRSDHGREVVSRLVQRSDVLVTNLRLGVLERLGFGFEEVQAMNADIIYLQATGFGEIGPLRYATGGDHWNQVLSGWCSIMGAEGGPPEILRCLGHIDFNTSMYNVAAVLTALVARERQGGARIATSMFEASIALQCTRLAEYLIGGIQPQRLGSASAVVAPSQAFRCQDDYLFISAESQRQWERLCTTVARPDLVAKAEYAMNADRVRHRAELAAELEPLFAERPVTWWLRTLTRERIPCARFWDFDTIVTHTQVVANQHVVALDPRRCGDAVTGGAPWKFAGTPAAVGPPTFSGSETESVLAQLAREAPPRRARPPTSTGGHTTGGQELLGLRFLDLSSGISGPYCGALLAEGGAEVIKLELPERDLLTEWGPPFVDDVGVAYLQLNRRKDIRVCDWHDAAGARALRDLAAQVDGVILDAIDSDGAPPPLSPAEVRDSNPRAIVVSTSPYGEQGPLGRSPGSELTIQAMSEALSGLGRRGDPPVRIGADQATLVGGLVAYQAVMAALFRRQCSGEGETVATSALGGLLCLRSYFLGSMSAAREWNGLWLTYSDPPDHGTQTADGPVLYTLNTRLSKAPEPEAARALLADLGAEAPEGMDPAARPGSSADPGSANWQDFWQKLFSRFTWAELAEIFDKHGGQVLPLLDYRGLDEHPQTAAMRPFVDEAVGPRSLRMVRAPWTITPTATTTRS